MLCLLTQPKEGQQQFKNKKQPERTENQTICKSNNQGIKEETFIQTGRRGRDRQPGGEDLQQGKSWQTRAGKAVAGRVSSPTLCADKLGGTTKEGDRLHKPGSNVGK